MADHERIHPVDPKAAAAAAAPQKSTTPLMTHPTRSENGDLERQFYPPPPTLTILRAPTKPPMRSNNCFKKCLCWTLALITIQIIIVAIIYSVFDSKTPKYSINAMRITEFNLSNDNTLSTTLIVNITARNPNNKVGIYYEGGSHLSMWYTSTKLCEGSLPEFSQGRRNTTVLSLALAGRVRDASGLLSSLRAAQQTGTVLLSLRARVPVRLKFGGLKLMTWKFFVRCRISVESLEQGNAVRIRDSSCKFRFRI